MTEELKPEGIPFRKKETIREVVNGILETYESLGERIKRLEQMREEQP